ncbi:methionine adenosyltransferase [Lachnospiraceae bacterium DSM 108991]|uniref:S-adenosylmethionine synthase n=1 Tax=Claveliimonas monacensis TaxID=2779351 RepID=A0ABR9RLK9_9FIRM|nr:methionine adenosyltransferase [Claveliimonas monacensis]MBE5063869.1 methionine adenosyltransferase [Claveliimonas monacensis]
MYKRYLTSEAVTKGHPDKICDQIADKILDECLRQDPESRVACEVSINSNLLVVMGEITSKAVIDIPKIAKQVIKDIGYNKLEDGFDLDNSNIIVSVKKQSKDIAKGVDKEKTGAGDQGMVFGYATNESAEFMPYSLVYANKMAKRIAELRTGGILPYLKPDGKTQVTIEYDQNGYVRRIDSIVVSVQHAENVIYEQIERDVLKQVIGECIPLKYLDSHTKYYINPTGRFVIGGPRGDSGLTGRKIIADSYGGAAHHGGGAFSGKDYTKVDRSGAYAARYVAKNIVAAGLAGKCEIQVSYAIGVDQPVAICVDTMGTGKISDTKIEKIISKEFDLSPDGIINYLDLKRPIYSQTSAYGHFGRDDLNLPWEKLDKVDLLKKYLEDVKMANEA